MILHPFSRSTQPKQKDSTSRKPMPGGGNEVASRGGSKGCNQELLLAVMTDSLPLGQTHPHCLFLTASSHDFLGKNWFLHKQK